MTTNVLYSLEILTNLLFSASHPSNLSNQTPTSVVSTTSTNRYFEIYLNIILPQLILFEIKINKFIINKNYNLIKKYKINNKIVNKINLLNNNKSNHDIPNILKIRNTLSSYINKTIINYFTYIKLTNVPKECHVRINEIISSNKSTNIDDIGNIETK